MQPAYRVTPLSVETPLVTLRTKLSLWKTKRFCRSKLFSRKVRLSHIKRSDVHMRMRCQVRIATSMQSWKFQTQEVYKLTIENFLQLNPSKCEIVSFSRQVAVSQLDLNIDGMSIQSSETAKCLGYIWKGTFSSKPMIESNISKARKAFFSYGSIGAFQGDRCPLSCRSVVDTCICPILFTAVKIGFERCCTELTSFSPRRAKQTDSRTTKVVLKYCCNGCVGLGFCQSQVSREKAVFPS